MHTGSGSRLAPLFRLWRLFRTGMPSIDSWSGTGSQAIVGAPVPLFPKIPLIQIQPIVQQHRNAPFLPVPPGKDGGDAIAKAFRILGGLFQRCGQVDDLPALDLDVNARQPDKVRLLPVADSLTGADGVPLRVQETAKLKLPTPPFSLL